MGEYDSQVFINPQAGEFVEYGEAQKEVLNQELIKRIVAVKALDA